MTHEELYDLLISIREQYLKGKFELGKAGRVDEIASYGKMYKYDADDIRDNDIFFYSISGDFYWLNNGNIINLWTKTNIDGTNALKSLCLPSKVQYGGHWIHWKTTIVREIITD